MSGEIKYECSLLDELREIRAWGISVLDFVVLYCVAAVLQRYVLIFLSVWTVVAVLAFSYQFWALWSGRTTDMLYRLGYVKSPPERFACK